jgi:hypothetical protein
MNEAVWPPGRVTQGVLDFGIGNCSFIGSANRVVFDHLPLFPDFSTLSNAAGTTSGSFTGNVDTAGIDVIGFSFLAMNA